MTYGTGSVSGNLATDTLHIGSLSASLTFGLATNVSDEFKSYPMDGILGIGRGDVVKGAAQVMDVLKADNLIGAKQYGIHLSRSKDGLQDGELNLGEPNTARYDGDLNWLDCIPNQTGFWEVNVADATVDGKKVGLKGKKGIIDTGTSYILMPPADALALHSLIPGFVQSGETFSVPCDTRVPLEFVFGNTAYAISTPDWLGGRLESGLCRSNIVGRQTFNDSQWLIGDVFLKNVYAVFDFDGSRVGLGLPGTGDEQQGSSGSSSSSTSSSSSPSSPSSPTSTAAMQPAASDGAMQTAPLEGNPSPTSSGRASTSARPAADSQGQSNATGGAVGLREVPLVLAVAAVALSFFA